jgi:AcrR family transcriptional regulator
VFPLSFLLFGLGFLGILVQREHRALHDLIAGSAVVYAWDARAARLRFLALQAELPASGSAPPGHAVAPRLTLSNCSPPSQPESFQLGLLDTASARLHDRTVIVKPNRDRRTERHEAIRREILDAAWNAAHETSIAGLTLRDIATRVGMQQPSLYSHFSSKQAIYDAMFKQAWQAFLDDARNAVGDLPAGPRARLIAIAEHYFDFAVADLPRHQLMDVNVVPNFQPSPEAYAPAVEVYNLMLEQLRDIGVTRDEDADIYTALIGGLVNRQLANDPGGQRWRRLIPRVMSMFADDLDLP